MTLELTPNGFNIQQLSEIKADYEDSFISEYGAGSQVKNSKSNQGKMVGIFADREAKIQEAMEGIYDSAYPSTATDVSLDRVMEITGVTRLGASASVVDSMFATGTVSSLVTAEQLSMSVTGTGEVFKNTATFSLGVLGDKTIDSITRSGATVTATISGGHSYPLSSWVFIEGADQEEYNILAQLTAITATTFDYELSGPLPISPATGIFEAKEATNFNAESVEGGEIQALQGALITIETAVLGVDRVENANDATLGRLIETDTEARTRRSSSLALQGGGTPEAIKAAVLNVAGVTNAVVFKNDTDSIDGDGLRPHSVKVLVSGGADQDIFDALFFDAVSGGIRMEGDVTGSVTDSSGNPQPAAFSRIAIISIFVDITVITNSDANQGPTFPASGETDIIDNLTTIPFVGGADVWKATIDNAVVSVQGVVSVVSKFDVTSSPAVDATIVITPAQIADIDSGDITGLIDGVPI